MKIEKRSDERKKFPSSLNLIKKRSATNPLKFSKFMFCLLDFLILTRKFL